MSFLKDSTLFSVNKAENQLPKQQFGCHLMQIYYHEIWINSYSQWPDNFIAIDVTSSNFPMKWQIMNMNFIWLLNQQFGEFCDSES